MSSTQCPYCEDGNVANYNSWSWGYAACQSCGGTGWLLDIEVLKPSEPDPLYPIPEVENGK